jgi:uncharacterized membrane protein (DUF106 family)
MAPTDEEPLPSLATAPADAAEAEEAEEETPTPAATSRPPPPTFKLATFVYVFLGMLGLLMVIDTSARNGLAGLFGVGPNTLGLPPSGPLYYAIGFGSNHILVTMAIAGAVEMLVTAFAYNYTTDWIKAAKVQKWGAAFRKVQMEAIRSGKKDRIAALKPHQERLTRLSSEVSIAQFKGMAITWFLLILIYTWIGLLIEAATAAQQTVSLGGASINLYTDKVFGYFPLWFFIFSLYTVPLSLVFRRVLKNYWLRRYMDRRPPDASAPSPTLAGRSA